MKVHRIGTRRRNDARPVVVFLHGFMGSAGDWAAVVEQLETDFACLTVDLPGHGHALVPESDPFPDIHETAASLAQGLVELNVRRYALVGYSMGGRLALYVALKFPQGIERVVLESATPGLSDPRERADRRAHDEALAHKLASDDFVEFLHRWYAQPLFASLHTHPGRLKDLVARRLKNDPEQLARSLRALGTGVQPPLWEALPKLGVPTLLLAGEKDGKLQGIAHGMPQAAPSARVEIVAECGHNIHFERPDAFVEVVRGFLSA